MTVLEKPKDRVSYHDSVEEMLIRIKNDGLTSVFSRWDKQETIRCTFCLQGVSCQLCTQGPCRISEKAGADTGVCGIGPDAMAKKVGAKGIHIVGSIETGQELLQRFEVDDVFVGLMGCLLWHMVHTLTYHQHHL